MYGGHDILEIPIIYMIMDEDHEDVEETMEEDHDYDDVNLE